MRRSSICRLCQAVIVSVSLIMPFAGSAFAQPSNPERTNSDTARVHDVRPERTFDWGWLGLLGLAGLLGMVPRRDREIHHSAVDVSGRPIARP